MIIIEVETPTGNREVIFDNEDYDRLPGSVSIGGHGYAQIWIKPRTYLVHRWVLGLMEKTGYSVIADHINRNKLDNRKENLRLISPSESNLNRPLPERDLPLGVYLAPSGRFFAQIKRNRKAKNLGTYDTIEEAESAIHNWQFLNNSYNL